MAISHHFHTTNPHNDSIIKSYKIDDSDTIDRKINHSKDTSKFWKKTNTDYRAEVVKKIATAVLHHKLSLAELCAIEMGKPMVQAIAEIEKSVKALEYFAEIGPKYLKRKKVEDAPTEAYIDYAPLGTVLAIMPWNFPFWQVLRVLGPALMAGNTFLLKHASNVTGCALELEKIIHDLEIPSGLFQVLLLPGSEASALIGHEDIHMVTFTGSSEVGKTIAQNAGAHLKKHILELGGSDAYIVLEDADIVLAARKCVQSRLNNAGQSCVAAKRWLVHQSIYNKFKDQCVALMQTYHFGNPLDEQFQIGPLVDIKSRNHVHAQVLKAVAAGAEIVIGGVIPDGLGAYYPPTLLEGLSPQAEVAKEEIFGPVALLYKFDTLEDALNIANSSPYGLGGAIFSKDEEKAYEIAQKHMDTGSIFINNMVVSHPALPFGGIKNSGYGRELSYIALYEFSNIKTISK